MRSSILNVTRAIIVVSALALGAASASAQAFDSKKFFEKLQADGASASMMPPMVDTKK